MYVRINTIFGEKSKIDAAVEYIEESDRPVVEAAAGNSGLLTLVDREAGLIVAASYWDEPLHSSEAVLTRVREGAVAVAGGDLSVESFEVAAQQQPAATPPGAAVRFARMQIELARFDEAISFFDEQVLPALTACAGLCSIQLLLDPGSGSGIVATAWQDLAAADAAEEAMARLHSSATSRGGVKFLNVEPYTLVRTSMRLS
ncbi:MULTISPECIES: hypothetical protein [unclassified Pseudonocardia]|jgi:hypothetical protein|uniref:hypothetical protein n=1 Tax=unclassified Pseudonocardia TaxID=2619320 RepID=UPI000960E643|nr:MULTISPECIES: hypothetical protein [unclassified Pseudonocardia]MBN9101071.1 hypothetical protein [Pseudonocardia sp.]OJY41435.1 MAG: hypothetical protein BGP03_20290 [Pseudonocardia sp. 73-21]